MYNIRRFYFKGGSRLIHRGLTLKQAQEHCKNPETSSSTCTNSAGKKRTKNKGDWFDGYEKEAI